MSEKKTKVQQPQEATKDELRKLEEYRQDVPPGIEATMLDDPKDVIDAGVHHKLLWVQSRMRVGKNRGRGHTPNAQVTYEYRNAEDILEAAKPLCAAVHAVLTLNVEPIVVGEGTPIDVREVKPGGTDKYQTPISPTFARAFGPRFLALARATFTDCNTGDSITCGSFAEIDFWRKGQTEPEKLSGSADSYASKYALGHLFALDNNKDADMESDTRPANPNPGF